MTGGSRVRGMSARLLILAGVCLYLFPLYWMLVGSLQPATDSLKLPPDWIPTNISLENYRKLFEGTGAARWFVNSVVVSLIAAGGAVVCGTMAGYALGSLRFPGSRFVLVLVVLALALPSSVLIVPLFQIMKEFGWINTYAGLIAPEIAFPFGVFLMAQFMYTIPTALFDAARVDGASEIDVFRSVAVPLTRPAQAAIGIFAFLATWNHYLWQVVITNTRDMQTLPVGVSTLAYGVESFDLGLSMAGATVAFIPMLVIFVAFQSRFQRGIVMGAMK